MLKKFFLLLVALMLEFGTASAAQKILFIPHDDRPVSCQQPAEVVEQLGYEILMPSPEMLTRPEELWRWLEENAPSANAAVVSSDALLYGGLFASRKHEIPADELVARVENFATLRKNNPNLQLYVFGSLMRTPSAGTVGDIEEPDYYGQHGADIFNYTRLLDKQEIDTLTYEEYRTLDELNKKIPADVLDDWFARRKKNLSATKKLIDFANDNIINCFIVGRDDNAPLSQTHRENRQLTAYITELEIPKTTAQSHAGIDEYAMLLLARAVNDLRDEFPVVYVQFNSGVGADTIPAYSDETLGQSVRDEIFIAGGLVAENPERADFVLFVNTDVDGQTYHTHNSFPPMTLTKSEKKFLRRNARYFASLVESAVKKKYPVGVADVTFANGADNELMTALRKKNLLFKLQAYGGWNTATNTTGFVLGTGMLTKRMSRDARNKLLARRYLDDWAYQANVRTQIAAELAERPDGLSIYIDLGEHAADIETRETKLMRKFAEKNLPHFDFLKNFTVTNPYRRMFECEIHFGSKTSR